MEDDVGLKHKKVSEKDAWKALWLMNFERAVPLTAKRARGATPMADLVAPFIAII